MNQKFGLIFGLIMLIGLSSACGGHTPVEREFDGVVMVFVPAGCFMMGNNGVDDEQPAHEQCFSTPFWIDKYEVSQAQFRQFGGRRTIADYFTGDDLPVENITWFEARDYCQYNRGGRLPTEAEWEYAARGPNNLIYPWGNDFVADNVVYSANSDEKTAPVGSRKGGASWVGAMDMSGNVWEWTSSLYMDYPYVVDDGRERDTGDDISVERVLRGASWNYKDHAMRPSNRMGLTPNQDSLYNGFRCMRLYSDV